MKQRLYFTSDPKLIAKVNLFHVTHPRAFVVWDVMIHHMNDYGTILLPLALSDIRRRLPDITSSDLTVYLRYLVHYDLLRPLSDDVYWVCPALVSLRLE